MMQSNSSADGQANATDQLHMVELEELASQPSGKSALLQDRVSLFSGVKARVTAVVGETHAPIGELLSLKEGAVLKLDRHVDAPIELRVEGRVIARGQLSVLGDQFAVRITEVVSGAKT